MLTHICGVQPQPPAVISAAHCGARLQVFEKLDSEPLAQHLH